MDPEAVAGAAGASAVLEPGAVAVVWAGGDGAVVPAVDSGALVDGVPVVGAAIVDVAADGWVAAVDEPVEGGAGILGDVVGLVVVVVGGRLVAGEVTVVGVTVVDITVVGVTVVDTTEVDVTVESVVVGSVDVDVVVAPSVLRPTVTSLQA